MKKFLCYDTNDAASGKIEVDNRGMLKPNSTVPSGSAPYKQLVTDGTGKAMWMDFIRVDFLSRDTGIVCSFTYDKVCDLLQKGPIQGYIYGFGLGCYSILYAIQNEHWVEFVFCSPDVGFMSLYYLEDGTITQNKPAV